MDKQPLVTQTGLTRKWKAGAIGAALMTGLSQAILPAMYAYDPEFAAQWAPLVTALMGALGFAVPAYAVRNRAVPQ